VTSFGNRLPIAAALAGLFLALAGCGEKVEISLPVRPSAADVGQEAFLSFLNSESVGKPMTGSAWVVVSKKLNQLDAYFVSDRMFACISGKGVGLRLPAATATELQFSRENVHPFQPGGTVVSKEWIQIAREDAAEYVKDLELFRTSMEYVKGGRGR
jgi:hypothetical protein